mmetsp:Transcript_21457/g.34055  ORF Transcript_21457/g.34055 Transcript_21457/m.34055 type:complete len:92 (+) Transcript_21457:2829-3104(+)
MQLHSKEVHCPRDSVVSRDGMPAQLSAESDRGQHGQVFEVWVWGGMGSWEAQCLVSGTVCEWASSELWLLAKLVVANTDQSLSRHSSHSMG